MCGGKNCVVAISSPQVIRLAPAMMRTTENTLSGNEDGLKMCVAPPLFVPPDQILGREADGNHQELQIEPVLLEPEEKVGAEDDRELAEAERVAVAVRPGEQHVERIREQQLRHEKVCGVVDRLPVPAPVEQDRSLGAGLQVVLLAEHDVDRQRPPPIPEQQSGVPHQQDADGADEGPEEPGIFLHGRRERERGQGEGESERETEARALMKTPDAAERRLAVSRRRALYYEPLPMVSASIPRAL